MEQCAHHVFEKQAAVTPDAVAVVASDTVITYAELDRRANALASRLHDSGVQPEAIVAMYLERSLDLIVAMLAIWKAGGAYLPLDPAHPMDRTAFMLADSGAAVIVTHQRLVGQLPSHTANVLLVAGEVADHRVSDSPVDSAVQSTNLACLLYTSGSTGEPKGVMLEHRNLVSLMESDRIVFGLGVGDRVLHGSALSFDASTWETTLALSSGAALCLAPSGVPLVGPELSTILRDNRITFAFVLPSVLLHQPLEHFPDLDTLVVGGEVCPEEVIDVWGRGRRFINAYGPTEITVRATIAECKPGEGTPSLGQAAPGARVYILDSVGNPVAPGEIGEIYLGGAGVARGYLHQPKLTASRFLPDPFADDAASVGARMYRTGDLGRWRPDGGIDFLGRSDLQLKIRGLRVEPGEIEAALRKHPAIRDVVVIGREATPGTTRLIAYLIGNFRGKLPFSGVKNGNFPRKLRYGLVDVHLASELRDYLRHTLPEQMIPTVFVALMEFPRSATGKIDRPALPRPDDMAPNTMARNNVAGDSNRSLSEIVSVLTDIWCAVLGVNSVGLDDPFFDIGGDSLLLVRVRTQIIERLGAKPTITELFAHPTIHQLAAFLHTAPQQPKTAWKLISSPEEIKPDRSEERKSISTRSEEGESIPKAADHIAIVGMVGRFPGAANIPELWSLLRECREGITHFERNELERAGVPDEYIRSPQFIPSVGVLPGAADFDAAFFGVSQLDAKMMDPQQRLFLESSWEALETAGYDPQRFNGPIGVFAGASLPRYWLERVATISLEPGGAASSRALVGNPLHLTMHVSHRLGLRGPALTVYTACSTSLVAVHLACQSLLSQECDLALAGGVSVYSLGATGYQYEDGGILSPDGHCRVFDAQAAGSVPASGVAIVVLKRLQDALADGDTITAVIRGSAMNNDGGRKIGYSAPSIDGQSEVIAQACRAAGVSPETIGYLEAHGTGTLLGDPVEVTALTRTFREHTGEVGYCGLGSMKSNVGHLDSAAGAAGLIKAALVVNQGEIPGTPHFAQPNPALELESSPFFVSSTTRPWLAPDDQPRRAGVSSFGIGGTNAHVIVEEPPAQSSAGASRAAALLVLSAKTSAALSTAVSQLSTYLHDHANVPLADIAFTLQHGRVPMAHRMVAIGSNHEMAAQALVQGDDSTSFHGQASDQPPDVVFMFPGGGTQYPNMGAELYRTETVYRDNVDQCAELFSTELGYDIRSLLFADDNESGDTTGNEDILLISRNTAAIFTTEYALARLLMSWGIQPAALIGHSLGEYAASCLAGVISLPDAVTLVALRGRLCEELPQSAMLIVPMAAEKLQDRLGPELAIAAVNGPHHCVVGGMTAAISELEAALVAEGIQARRLPLIGSTHTSLVEPVMDQLTDRAAGMELKAPQIPIVSNVTGSWLTAAAATDPSYWARHMRNTVQFAQGIGTLLHKPGQALIEVGPGHTLATLAAFHPSAAESRLITTTMDILRPEQTETEAMLGALGRLWCESLDVDWAALSAGEQRRRVPLPTYPFERQTYILEASNNMSDTDTERLLAKLWCEILGVDSVVNNDNFFASGGDSLLAVQLHSRIQQEMGVTTTVHAVLEHPTFDSLLRHLHDLSSVNSKERVEPARMKGQLLVTIKPHSSNEPPLFFAQSIGGTVFSYRGLISALDPTQGVYAFRASGMEPGEGIYTDIGEMAAHYVTELRSIYPTGPYIIGGHSTGGIIAYEMAYQLRQQNFDVPLLILIDSISVQQAHDLNVDSAEKLATYMEAFKQIAPQAWQAFTTALTEDSFFRKLVVDTNQALVRYQPRPCDVDILFIRAAERDRLFDAHPEAWWMDLTQGMLTVHNIPSNHLTIMEPPHINAVGAIIRAHLGALALGKPLSSGQPGSIPSEEVISVTSRTGLRVEGLTVEATARLLKLIES